MRLSYFLYTCRSPYFVKVNQTIFMEEKLVNLEVGEVVFFFNVTPVASPKNVL